MTSWVEPACSKSVTVGIHTRIELHLPSIGTTSLVGWYRANIVPTNQNHSSGWVISTFISCVIGPFPRIPTRCKGSVEFFPFSSFNPRDIGEDISIQTNLYSLSFSNSRTQSFTSRSSSCISFIPQTWKICAGATPSELSSTFPSLSARSAFVMLW